ncbi:phosphotransferase [Actinomyces oricola]|uniref:phosphotransferase n=1 Tax=Actinomyces oricola TaxID=206043 RepID=UPI000FFEE014|nr:phosphotransferase [Actinomyces oricola]
MADRTQVPAWPEDAALLAALESWMRDRRWFPLKGDAAPEPGSLSIIGSWELAPSVRDLLVSARRTGSRQTAPVLMHVPVVLESAAELARFAVDGEAPGSEGVLAPAPDGSQVALVDGAHHPAFWRAWALAALAAGTTVDPAGTRAIAQRAQRLRVITGEQSNTSVVMPAPAEGQEAQGREDGATGDVIVKLFRVLAAGRNPDVEVCVALAHDGWQQVPPPVAWSTLTWSDPDTGQEATTDAAVACAFIPRARDGFSLFCDLARQDDAGGPARRRAIELATDLAATTARMHAHLASALGTADGGRPAELAAGLRRRAAWALDEVPALIGDLPGLQGRLDALLADLAALPRLAAATRVHGDYHLGQVLHTSSAEGHWYVLDFEGEPLRPLAERSAPDQPARDVAGMLRSFDYAAAVGRAQDPSWLPAVRAAFLRGYRDAAPPRTPEQERTEDCLLAALEFDKALYEAVYEARNRPTWLTIPVNGLKALLAGGER